MSLDSIPIGAMHLIPWSPAPRAHSRQADGGVRGSREMSPARSSVPFRNQEYDDCTSKGTVSAMAVRAAFPVTARRPVRCCFSNLQAELQRNDVVQHRSLWLSIDQ